MSKKKKSRLQKAVEKAQASLEFRERMEEVLRELRRGLPSAADGKMLSSRVRF